MADIINSDNRIKGKMVPTSQILGNSHFTNTIQSDYEENNRGSVTYIKNRPFYSDGIIEKNLLNDTFKFEYYEEIDVGYYWMYQDIALVSEIISGAKYIVVFDGISYDLESYLNGSEDIILLGNGSIWDSSISNTNEPFVIVYNIVDKWAELEVVSTELNHSISITILEENIKKLDEKFLPYNVYTSSSAPIYYGEGKKSTIQGLNTTASGNYSHAEGQNTIASGESSHAEGYSTTSSNFTSHAEGNNTTASGYYSHAEGQNTIASGESSHAEGYSTTASGNYSHAEGNSSNKFSDVVTKSNPTNDEIISSWKSKKFSLVKGNSSHVEGYNSLALADYSHAEGQETKASDTNSHAEGYSTTASGTNSHAEGNNTTASGSGSHAEGFNTKASNTYSHAEGYSTTASGTNSHAEGNNTTAQGSASHAEGYSTTASGIYSHAEGQNTIASNTYSHAEGNNTHATGNSSHAEGYYTEATGDNSHAEGNNTHAKGSRSHSEGCSTTATGIASHAEGQNTSSFGNYSHAEGYHTIALKNYSHAEGFNTIADSTEQHIQGKYNIGDSSNTYADIIGNGDSETNRSNAATVDWHGNAWYAGDVYTGSTSGTNKDEGSKKLATEEYVNNAISTIGPYFFELTKTDYSVNSNNTEYTITKDSDELFNILKNSNRLCWIVFKDDADRDRISLITGYYDTLGRIAISNGIQFIFTKNT